MGALKRVSLACACLALGAAAPPDTPAQELAAGQAAYKQGHAAEAVADYHRAAELLHVAHDVREGVALLWAAQVENQQARADAFRQAAADAARAIPLLQAAHDDFSLGFARWAAGDAADGLGHAQEARDAYAAALDTVRRPVLRAHLLHALSRSEYKLGNLAPSRAADEQALILLTTPDQATYRGDVLMLLARTCEAQGDRAAALSLQAEAAKQWHALGNAGMAATVEMTVARLALAARDYAAAADAARAASKDAATTGDELRGQALMMQGLVAEGQGDYRAAFGFTKNAVPLLKNPNLRATVLLAAGTDASRVHDYAAARPMLEAAIALREVDPGAAAGALSAEAEIDADTGAQKDAVDKLHQAQAIFANLHDTAALNRVRSDLGLAYAALGRMPEALAAQTDSLAAARASGEAGQEAASLINLGTIRQSFGDARQAADLFQQAVSVAQKIGDRNLEGIGDAQLGMALHDLGDKGARDALGRAREIAKSLHDTHAESIALNDLALVESAAAPQRALDIYAQARALLAASPDPSAEATTLGNIGGLYRSLGNADRARTYLQQALTVETRLGDDAGRAVTLNNLAVLEQSADQPRTAQRLYTQARDIVRRLGNRQQEANIQGGLAIADATLGDTDTATRELQAARAVAHQDGALSSEAIDCHNLATVREQAGDLAGAAEALHQALDLWARLHDAAGEAASLGVLARVEAEQGALDTALIDAARAIARTESIRAQVQGADLRATYLARSGSVYAQQVAILMRLDHAHPGAGYAARAFAASEHARARSLLELLATRRGPDEKVAAIEREMAAKAAQRAKLAPDDPEAARLDHEIDEKVAEAEALEPQAGRTATLELPTVQRLLEPGTMLLDYALGDAHAPGVLFAISTSGLRSFPLAPRAEIEAAVRDWQESLLDTANPVPAEAAAKRLGGLLLAPLAAGGHERLVIVADAALQGVPFAALPGPDGRLLVRDHEIVGEPSASALAAIRVALTSRPAPPRPAIVFADAVYGPSDARLAHPAPPAGDELPRLPQTEDEARAIAGLTHGSRVTGFAATREAAGAPALSDYRIVHFATHGLVDARTPALSGLVLSQFGPDGAPTPGMLSLADILALHLPAELVVLSACESGQGKPVGGEGLLGLTRGFFAAGAGRVVASLWQIDDAATARLMTRFYDAMVTRGLAPAAALRQAQLDMLADPHASAPIDWAGWTLLGEWRPMRQGS